MLAYTVEREFPDDDGVVRGVGGRLPGAGVPVALRQNAQAAAGNAGFDPVSFAIADRAAAEAWTAHFDELGVRHSGIRGATQGWVVDVYDPEAGVVGADLPHPWRFGHRDGGAVLPAADTCRVWAPPAGEVAVVADRAFGARAQWHTIEPHSWQVAGGQSWVWARPQNRHRGQG